MVDLVLRGILLLSPICYLRGIPLNNCDIFFFHFGSIALFIASLFDIKKRELSGKRLIACLLGLCLFSVLVHHFDMFVMNYAVNIFLAVLDLTIIITYLKDVKGCYKYIVYAGVINMVVWGFQTTGFSPILDIGIRETIGGIMGNSARFSIYLCLIAPFLIHRTKVFLLPLLVIPFVAHELNMFMSLFLLLMLGSIYKYWKILFAFLAVIFLAIFNTHLTWRLNEYRAVLMAFFNQPLFGFGLGIFPFGQSKVVTSSLDYHIFSSLLQFIVCGGLLSVPLIYLTMRKYVNRFRSSPESLSIAILLLLCLGEYPLEITRLWFTIIAVIGFTIITREDRLENIGH